MGYFAQQLGAHGSTGSSTMPHKVNPIRFENAEANLEVSCALLDVLASTLVTSRLQRDLTDSSMQRTIGTAFGHSLLSIDNVRRGLAGLEADPAAMARDLDAAWEVLGEPIQSAMRALAVQGVPGMDAPYERLKELTRGPPGRRGRDARLHRRPGPAGRCREAAAGADARRRTSVWPPSWSTTCDRPATRARSRTSLGATPAEPDLHLQHQGANPMDDAGLLAADQHARARGAHPARAGPGRADRQRRGARPAQGPRGAARPVLGPAASAPGPARVRRGPRGRPGPARPPRSRATSSRGPGRIPCRGMVLAAEHRPPPTPEDTHGWLRR